MFLSSCTTLVSCILVPSDQFLLLLLVYEKTKKKFTFSCFIWLYILRASHVYTIYTRNFTCLLITQVRLVVRT